MQTRCRHFSGYKPCGLNTDCNELCPHLSLPETRILLIHLGAMGAVLRSTSLLPAIHRKYPNAHITWVTDKICAPLIHGLASIDRVVTLETTDLLSIHGRNFDVAFVIDKSMMAGGILNSVNASEIFGFVMDANTGAILPATDAAEELWQLGLSNYQKFHQNSKPETQLVSEALELPYARDDYSVAFSAEELQAIARRRALWAAAGLPVIGINTGCSSVIPYKKLSVEYQRALVRKLSALNLTVVLLGGPEDEVRNQQISHGLTVISSPTNRGVRDGLFSVAACDLVITGDSLGMHMAIALQKWVVAWFGPTCAHEIDLYDRGVRILAKAPCGPCWRRSCHKETMCYDLVDSDEILAGVQQGLNWLRQYSIPHSSEIYSSPSRCLSGRKPLPEPNP